MNRMNRDTRTVALAVLGAFLAACSPARPPATATGVGYGKDQPAVQINVWYMPNGSAPDDYFRTEAAGFNAAHPNIHVKGTPVSWGDAFNKITAALASGVGPDVTQLGPTWVGAFSRTGGLHQSSQAEIDGLGGSSAFFPAS